jgi:hypothetical protein
MIRLSNDKAHALLNNIITIVNMCFSISVLPTTTIRYICTLASMISVKFLITHETNAYNKQTWVLIIGIEGWQNRLPPVENNINFNL